MEQIHTHTHTHTHLKRIFNLGTVNIWDQIILCIGKAVVGAVGSAVLCFVECIAASLASVPWMPVTPHFPRCDNQKNVFRHYHQMSVRGQNHPGENYCSRTSRTWLTCPSSEKIDVKSFCNYNYWGIDLSLFSWIFKHPSLRKMTDEYRQLGNRSLCSVCGIIYLSVLMLILFETVSWLMLSSAVSCG